MKIKTRLTIRAMMLWEQMTGRGFRNIDFSDADDAQKALYCASVVYAEAPYTYEEFLTVLQSARIARDYIKALARYNEYVMQFVTPAEPTEEHAAEDGDTRIGEVAATLILHGIDAHFVLDEMMAGDIPLYTDAINEKLKHEEESRRLWTYLSVLPHVGSKKLKSPESLYKFPWEHPKAAKTKSETEDAIREFRKFMSGEMGGF